MKTTRRYAPFQKIGSRWVRVVTQSGEEFPAMSLANARTYYQSLLLAHAFGHGPVTELRPVPVEPADLVNHSLEAMDHQFHQRCC